MIDEILLKNFEQFARFTLGFGLLFLSIFYVTVVQKRWKKTPFFTVGIARTIMYFTSLVIIVISPLALPLLSPEFPIDQFYYIIMLPYLIYVSLLLLIASVESLIYIPTIIMKIGGMDPKDARVNKGVREIKRFIKRR
jgi:hypothetical protein